MTEAEWLACNNPEPMLKFLWQKASERKLRLFAVACWRRTGAWFVPRAGGEVFREAAETAERFADGRATGADLRAANKAADALLDTDYLEDYAAVMTALPNAWKAADHTALLSRDFFGKLASDGAWTRGASRETQWAEKRQANATEGREQARLLLDISNNPFRPVTADPAWLAWNGGAVVTLAQTVYDERLLPYGELDPARFSVLADALEDADCDNQEMLTHLRGPGPHENVAG
jgi:hypothetical protein